MDSDKPAIPSRPVPPIRSSRAIRIPASWASLFSHTGSRLDQSSRGPKRASARSRRSRLSIRVMERTGSTECARVKARRIR